MKWLHVLNRRTLSVLLLGFSSGIPLALTGSTLQAWMATEKIDIQKIGLFALVGVPYTLKFLWAPLMDRFSPPVLGRRRGWVLITQILLIAGILLMGLLNPVSNLWALALMAVLVAFFSASQDIVIDAYRTDVLPKSEIGPGAAFYITGYRVAMLVSGAVALILSDHMPWRSVYAIMAATMLLGVLTSLFAPEPAVEGKPPKSLGEAVVMPFVEFFKRRGAYEVLAFITLYKLDVVIALALTTPFMMELGFSRTDIGAVTKGFGLVATIVGTLIGGTTMVKLGIKKSLWVFGLLQGFSGLSFTLLAHLGHHYPMMVTAIAVENLCNGMGTAVYSAFLMSLCNKRFSATQYALLSSVMALTRVIGSSPTGYLAKSVGWQVYFVISMLAAIPGLLLLLRYDRWQLPSEEEK